MGLWVFLVKVLYKRKKKKKNKKKYKKKKKKKKKIKVYINKNSFWKKTHKPISCVF